MVVNYHVAANEDVNDPCYGIVKAVKYLCSDVGEFGAFVLNWTSTKASGKLGWLSTCV